MMKMILQFIQKYEFWFLIAIAAGLIIASVVTGDAVLPGITTVIFIIAVTRLAMHPMWKKEGQAEEE